MSPLTPAFLFEFVYFVSQPKEQRRTPLKIAVSSPIQYMSIIYCFILSKHFPWNNIDISCSESCCGCWLSVVFLLSSRIADWKFSLGIFKCSVSVVCDFFVCWILEKRKCHVADKQRMILNKNWEKDRSVIGKDVFVMGMNMWEKMVKTNVSVIRSVCNWN